jgi:succinylarginine dihydrolase
MSGLFEDTAKPIKPFFPHRAPCCHPLFEDRKSFRDDFTAAGATDFLFGHESAFLQQLQMLQDSRKTGIIF